MRIAILGTRGIPNQYGGFERFAEVISAHFAELGHTVYVSSPSIDNSGVFDLPNHVNLVRVYIPSWISSNVQTLYYDLKSLIWASKNNIDVVLECGYSHSIWLIFFRKTFWSKIVTNPDGLEFSRKKWNLFAKTFLRICEKLAIRYSVSIVCDSPALVDYYRSKYSINPKVIPYGAFPVRSVPDKSILKQFTVPDDYYLMISRLTPENNIEPILESFSKNGFSLVVVGDFTSRYGQHCFNRYRLYSNIIFLGKIYDQNKLDTLRYYAKAYIHGHSVGGTNPSLVEAMSCKCFVIAHDNVFNRTVLNNEGMYFNKSDDLKIYLEKYEKMELAEVLQVKQKNYQRIIDEYDWVSVSEKYLELFDRLKVD